MLEILEHLLYIQKRNLIHVESSIQHVMYVHDVYVQHSFKIIFFSIDPVIDNCCKSSSGNV